MGGGLYLGSGFYGPGSGRSSSSSGGSEDASSSSSTTSSGIPRAAAMDILKTFQAATQPQAVPKVTQPGIPVSTSTQADPRLSQMYGEFGAARSSLAGNVDEAARLAMARGQEAGDRAQQMAGLGAAQRGFSPESGVSRLLGQKAQMQSLQAQQATNADLANQGRLMSNQLLTGQTSAASQLANTQLAAQQASMQNTFNAQQMAQQQAQAELAAQQQAQQNAFQMATLLSGLFTG